MTGYSMDEVLGHNWWVLPRPPPPTAAAASRTPACCSPTSWIAARLDWLRRASAAPRLPLQPLPARRGHRPQGRQAAAGRRAQRQERVHPPAQLPQGRHPLLEPPHHDPGACWEACTPAMLRACRHNLLCGATCDCQSAAAVWTTRHELLANLDPRSLLRPPRLSSPFTILGKVFNHPLSSCPLLICIIADQGRGGSGDQVCGGAGGCEQQDRGAQLHRLPGGARAGAL